jgi:carboxymethylenebutenolidase
VAFAAVPENSWTRDSLNRLSLYPAGHGFNCDQRAAYHAESARQARGRTLAFLREHVG